MSEKLGYGPPPPEDLAMEAINALFPPRQERPKPRTLYDDLPDGLSDPGVAPGPLKMPEPLVLVKERKPDELVPAFARTRRVSLNDMPQIGWVISRLAVRAGLSPQAALAVVRGCMVDVSGFCQMTDHAIVSARYLLTPPHVEVMFLLHNDHGPEGGHIKGSQGEKDGLHLLRLLRDWGKLQGAQAITRISDVSDLPLSVLTHELCKRREEAWMPLA